MIVCGRLVRLWPFWLGLAACAPPANDLADAEWRLGELRAELEEVGLEFAEIEKRGEGAFVRTPTPWEIERVQQERAEAEAELATVTETVKREEERLAAFVREAGDYRLAVEGFVFPPPVRELPEGD